MEYHIRKILDILKDINLDKRDGALLYSGNKTLSKGDWYFLGSNPGGHKDQFSGNDTIENQLLRERKDFNEYFDGEWISKYTQTVSPPGQQEHQRNIKSLFKDINVDLRKTCSTNLCFVRSKMEHSYEGDRVKDNRLCWRVHEYILSVVKPKYILCNGSTPRDFIKKKLVSEKNNEKSYLQLRERLRCQMFEGSLHLNSQNFILTNVKLISIPHLGYYTYYPESADWINELK